ncbi:hypothetical protein [Lysobacter brunescens]|uniref:Uncharacterized protein n=1 Tax=Lysobacter brunescens TaxID=262323 RepID=A0ABW2Y8K1_9GAMM
MDPVPSNITKSYPRRGPLQQFRFADGTAFRCFRCGDTKKSKLITLYAGDWARKLCNGCYGLLLSLYEIKAGAAAEDVRAEQLAEELLSLVSANQLRQAERIYRASEKRAEVLAAHSLRFVATAEHVAAQLDSDPQLEWSPAVIGLCKAVEAEVVSRILVPLAVLTASEDLSEDKKDKDIGRIAAYCIDSGRKPPELGTFAHFLQTVVHSQERRETSRLIRCFLSLIGDWVGSVWILDPQGFHRALATLTTSYRNRAAHIEELSRQDYIDCREHTFGNKGLVWQLVIATEKTSDCLRV